jgi:hypothetical protein
MMNVNVIITKGMFHVINRDVGNNAASPTMMRFAITLSGEHKNINNGACNQSVFSPTIRGSVITVSVGYADIDSIQNNSQAGVDHRSYDPST